MWLVLKLCAWLIYCAEGLCISALTLLYFIWEFIIYLVLGRLVYLSQIIVCCMWFASVYILMKCNVWIYYSFFIVISWALLAPAQWLQMGVSFQLYLVIYYSMYLSNKQTFTLNFSSYHELVRQGLPSDITLCLCPCIATPVFFFYVNIYWPLQENVSFR